MKILLFLISIFFSCGAQADWSESYGGDGIVSDFVIIARGLVGEMESAPSKFDKDLVANFKKSIDETLVASEESLFLNGIEKDAINYTLDKPYKIVISRKRWIQYAGMIEVKERLVLHEYLFTLRINDTDYSASSEIYMNLIKTRIEYNNDNRLGPFLLEASANCNEIGVSKVISLQANLNYLDKNNTNALNIAASVGCAPLVVKFIKYQLPYLVASENNWDPQYAAFVGSLNRNFSSGEFRKFTSTLMLLHKYYSKIDDNKTAIFPADQYPPQLNYCSGQTMLMRAVIGVNFYKDEGRMETIIVRNKNLAKLFILEGASISYRDDCGLSAFDYAEKFGVDIAI